MRDNEIDQIGRHDQMQVGAVVIPYGHVNGHGGRRLIHARLRLAAKLRIGMDPSFDGQ